MQYRNVCTVTSTSSNWQDGRVGRTNSHPVRKFPGHAFGRNMSETSFYPRIIRCLGRFLRRARAGLPAVGEMNEANASSYFGVNVLLAAVVP